MYSWISACFLSLVAAPPSLEPGAPDLAAIEVYHGGVELGGRERPHRRACDDRTIGAAYQSRLLLCGACHRVNSSRSAA